MPNQLWIDEEAVNNSTRIIRERIKGGNADKCLALYFKEIGKIPLLSLVEEKDLARRARAGDHDALQRLVTGNLRFVDDLRVPDKISLYP
jgi:DNA-directed RNA polymerase sigma subunit (sigma70/sigma32)